jgi:hypothetical protein
LGKHHSYYLGRYKGAPVLKGEPGTPEFLTSYQAATAKRRRDRERVTETPEANRRVTAVPRKSLNVT